MVTSYIAGVDEAGRGAWAGNIVAAAVILPADYDLPNLNDSKKLTAKKRDILFDAITTQAICWSYGQLTPQEIDRLNIHRATLEAMRQAVSALLPIPNEVIIDGKFVPDVSMPARAIVGGDGSQPEIAAASIVAKVVRDRQLIALDEIYPQYGFFAHKGYGTAKHAQALDEFGVTPFHRKSYAPIKQRLVKSN